MQWIQQLARDGLWPENRFIHHFVISDKAVSSVATQLLTLNYRGPSSLKCIVWWSVSSEQFIGPFFGKNVKSDVVKINGQRYIGLLENIVRAFVQPKSDIVYGYSEVERYAIVLKPQWCFCEYFWGTTNLERSGNNWLPRFPDLALPDFFLRGCLKEFVVSKSSLTNPRPPSYWRRVFVIQKLEHYSQRYKQLSWTWSRNVLLLSCYLYVLSLWDQERASFKRFDFHT